MITHISAILKIAYNNALRAFLSQFWQPPQHVILPITITCIVGIAIQSIMPIFVLCIPLCLLLALSFIKNKQYLRPILYLSGLLFGVAFLYEQQTQNHVLAMQHIASLDTLQVKVIDKEPVEHSRLYKEWITGEIQSNMLSLLWPWKIYIYSMRPSNYMPGDIIKISNYRTPSMKKNDFSSFLCKEHVVTTLFLTTKEKITLLIRPTRSLTRWLWQKRTSMLNVFKQNSLRDTFELSSCIFWGNKNSIKQSPETKESFKKIGITHYLARSGLHLIIFMFIWQSILKFFFISHRKKTIILVAMGFAYFLLTWPSISFFRALALFLLFNIATFNKMRTHIFYLLCLICTFFLIYNPMQLFFLDFQLTFGLTCALIWHNHIEHRIKLATSFNQ